MTESVERVSRLSQYRLSYGRTDGRTNEEVTYPPVDIFPVRYAHDAQGRFSDEAEQDHTSGGEEGNR